MHARLRAAGKDDVGVAAANRLRPLSHCMGAGRARRHGRVVRPAQPEVDRDLSARRVDEDVGEEPRRDPRVPPLAKHVVLFHHADDATDRRADEDSGPGGVDPLDAGVRPCLARRRDGEHDVALEPARVLRARRRTPARSPSPRTRSAPGSRSRRTRGSSPLRSAPRRRRSHVDCASSPSGVTAPRPVTTTRRMRGRA